MNSLTLFNKIYIAFQIAYLTIGSYGMYKIYKKLDKLK